MREPQSTDETSRQRSRKAKISAAFATVILTLGSGITSAVPSSAALTPDFCEFAMLIAVRGTNAPAGKGSMHSDRLYTSGGFGSEFQTLQNYASAGDVPWFVTSLKYPAVAISVDNVYTTSLAAGTASLVAELNYLADACGINTPPAVFLMGHSQGGAVVLNALSSPNLTTSGRGIVMGAAVFGEPNYAANQPINAPGVSQNSNNGMFGPRSAAQIDGLNSYKHWGWPQYQSSEGWVYKIRSYCLAGDRFCANSMDANAIDIHNSYAATTQVNDAFQWFQYLLTDFN